MEPNSSEVGYIIVENGIITEIGDMVPEGEYHTFDLKNRTLLPGFIDSHSHWIGDRDRVPFSQDEAVADALSKGWTTISENFVNFDRLEELKTMDSENRLHLRVNAYLPINYQEQRFGEWYLDYEPLAEESENVRIAGVKLFMDNGIDYVLDYLSVWFNASELNPIVKTAYDSGFQIYIHSMSDIGTDLALNALKEAYTPNSSPHRRDKLTHAWYLRDDQISDMAEMEMIVDGQLLWHTTEFNPWIDDALLINATEVAELMPMYARWRDVIDANITFTGSTDMPWGQPEELQHKGSATEMLYRAVTRIGKSGGEPHPVMINQRITVMEALESMTINGAYATFEEDIKGTIKTGKLGDFTILSDNPLEVDSEDIPEIDVDMTIIGGKVKYCRENLGNLCNPEYRRYFLTTHSTTDTQENESTEISTSTSDSSISPILTQSIMIVALLSTTFARSRSPLNRRKE